MKTARMDREGFAMVTTLLVVLVVSVLAVAVAWIASSEKKTSFAGGVHERSVFAADAGGEAGINFIRLAETLPDEIDPVTHKVRAQGATALAANTDYAYDAFYGKNAKPEHIPGWMGDYQYMEFDIASRGSASRTGNSDVALVVLRLYKDE